MTTQSPAPTKTFRPITMPRLLLHLEGLALLVTMLVIYANQGFNWWAFVLFLLAPDLALFFYLANQRVGSIAYNLAHTTIFPLALGVFGVFGENSLGMQIALIWLAHIGMDRAVGYGFKYAGNMKGSHFSHI